MNLKMVAVVAGTLGVLAAGRVARADDEATTRADGPTGFEFGLRIGYSVPAGNTTGASTETVNGTTVTGEGQSLSNVYSGRVPFTLDAGYRIIPHVYVGAFFTYGILTLGNALKSAMTNGVGCSAGVSCSADEIDLGANVHYHALPGQLLDPWVGLGFGYEWTTVHLSQGSQSGSVSVHGFQYFNAMLGLDILADPRVDVAFGPFVMVSFGQYDSISASSAGVSQSIDLSNKAMHEWITFGVRGIYDVKP